MGRGRPSSRRGLARALGLAGVLLAVDTCINDHVIRDAPPNEAAARRRPLTASERARLTAGAVDVVVGVDRHFVIENETRHDVLLPLLRGRGGAYLGVGATQSYTLAAAADAELVLLVDYDRRIVALHALAGALFEQAEDPDAWLAWLAPGRAAALERLLRARLGPVAAAPAIALVRGERPRLRAHFAGLRVKAVDGRPTTWLADPRLYATIRDLHRAGRVRALLGDLAGETSMRTIAAALTSLATPITVVYVSNAEESLLGRPSYRRNLEALPRVADAVLLRTIADDAWAPADGLWAYQAQPIAALLRRLAAAPELRLEDMLAEARRDGAASSGGSVGLTILDAPGAVASRRAR